MMTSAPSSASRNATARPSRFTPPVTRATRPCKEDSGFLLYSIICEPETVAHSSTTGIPSLSHLQVADNNVCPNLQSPLLRRKNESRRFGNRRAPRRRSEEHTSELQSRLH